METSLKDPVGSGWIVEPRSTDTLPPDAAVGRLSIARRIGRATAGRKNEEPMLPTGSLETVLCAMARTVAHGPRSVKATRPCLFHPDQYIYAGKRGGKFLTPSPATSVQVHGRKQGSSGRAGPPARAGGAPTPALGARVLVALAAAIGAAVATPAVPAASPPARDAFDPVLPYLAEEDYEQARPRILEALRLEGGASCKTLAAYAKSRSGRVREHAVRALADAGCAAFESYHAYLDDPDAWVTEA